MENRNHPHSSSWLCATAPKPNIYSRSTRAPPHPKPLFTPCTFIDVRFSPTKNVEWSPVLFARSVLLLAPYLLAVPAPRRPSRCRQHQKLKTRVIALEGELAATKLSAARQEKAVVATVHAITAVTESFREEPLTPNLLERVSCFGEEVAQTLERTRSLGIISTE